MNNKKNIERLFTEKFKDFESIPPEKNWNELKAKLLEKNKKRRVIPFWFKSAGIAASLILGFFILKDAISFNTSTIKNNEIIFDKTKSVSSTENKKEEPLKKNETDIRADENFNNNIYKNASYNKDNINATNKNKLNSSTNNNFGTVIVKHNIEKNKENSSIFNNNENKIDALTKTNILSKDNNLAVLNTNLDKTLKDSISSKIAMKEENALEQLLKKQEEEGKNVVEKEKVNKWAVGTYAAPIFYNSLSKGSPLDKNLISNNKTYNNSVSYGANIKYALSDKWAIRGGVNKLDVSYNTNDVLFYQSLQGKTPEHIATNVRGEMLRIENKSSAQFLEISASGYVLDKFSGQILQETGYLEVPLELSYKLLNKRFGIELIGGLSTLFLNENKISLVSEENAFKMEIGSANNLNNVHFSGNFGVGLKYKIFKSFQANLEPTFKYQINPYSEGAGNFKPYVIGVYSGISYNF